MDRKECPECGGKMLVFDKQYTRKDLRQEEPTPSYKTEICLECPYYNSEKIEDGNNE